MGHPVEPPDVPWREKKLSCACAADLALQWQALARATTMPEEVIAS